MDQDNAAGRAMGSSSPSPQAAGVKQELAEDAKTIGKAAQDRLGSKANEGKDQASQAARSTSSALDKAVEELRQDDATPAWLTSGFEKAAREIDRFASTLEGKDMQAIGRDVAGFARRSPIAFLAASAIAGFAAARVLRAGSDYRDHGGVSVEGKETSSRSGADWPTSPETGASTDRSSFNWADEGTQPGSNFERIGQ